MNEARKADNKTAGFTLIEVMIVVAVKLALCMAAI